MLKPYYKNTQSVSTEFARSYYVPFGESDKQSYDRDDSSRFTSLCGMWKIAAYDSIQDVSDDFYLTDGEKDIPVPSCVQYFGYDFFQYTNTRFPFRSIRRISRAKTRRIDTRGISSISKPTKRRILFSRALIAVFMFSSMAKKSGTVRYPIGYPSST